MPGPRPVPDRGPRDLPLPAHAPRQGEGRARVWGECPLAQAAKASGAKAARDAAGTRLGRVPRPGADGSASVLLHLRPPTTRPLRTCSDRYARDATVTHVTRPLRT